MKWRSDERGLSDIVGSLLLVGITVLTVGGLSFAVLKMPAPTPDVAVDLALRLDPGDDLAWGTGDEQVILRHRGGEDLVQDTTRIQVTIDGAMTPYSGAALGFSGGRLSIGERWTTTHLLAVDADVDVDIVVDQAGASVALASLGAQASTGSCSPDISPPAAAFVQTPPDINSLSGSTNITVNMTLVDTCGSVDGTAVPVLEYTVGTGSPKAMINIGPDQWQATIDAPAGGWSSEAGAIITYKATNLKDTEGNTGESPIQKDKVELVGAVTTYPASHTANQGTVTNFAASQAAGDSDASAVLTESSGGGGGSMTLSATAVTKDHPRWSNTNKAFAIAGGEADYDRNQEHRLQYGLADPASTPGVPQTVTVKIRQEIGPFLNDGWQLAGCILQNCSTLSPIITGSAAWSDIGFDVTNRRPGGGSWTWDDIKDLEVYVKPRNVYDATNGNENDGKFRIDYVFAVVTYDAGQGLNVDYSFSAPLAATTYGLELRYRVTSETFRVSIWDGATWNARATILDQTTFTDWSTSLNLAEYNGGSVQVRFESLASSPTQGTLRVDYARVITT